MAKQPNEIRRSSKRIKARLDVALDDAEQIQANLKKGEKILTYTLSLVDPLVLFISKFRTILLPSLQKESGEAMYAGEQVKEKMKISSEYLKKSQGVLVFTYGADNPRIEEYFSQTTWGFGRKPDPRIRTHKRCNEAFERHKDDFIEPLAQHFEATWTVGKELEEAWNNFLKEEKEAARIMEECINTLAEYKKLRRKIRNRLKGEFDDPQEAYKYIPKRKIKKKSS